MFRPLSTNTTNGRGLKRRKVRVEESDDEFGLDAGTEAAFAEEGMLHEASLILETSAWARPVTHLMRRLSWMEACHRALDITSHSRLAFLFADAA